MIPIKIKNYIQKIIVARTSLEFFDFFNGSKLQLLIPNKFSFAEDVSENAHVVSLIIESFTHGRVPLLILIINREALARLVRTSTFITRKRIFLS